MGLTKILFVVKCIKRTYKNIREYGFRIQKSKGEEKKKEPVYIIRRKKVLSFTKGR